MIHAVIIDAGGSFHWDTGVGGLVSGEAASNETNRNGKLRIDGSTMIVISNEGTEESYTFVPLPGNPIIAFTLGPNMFTRAN